MVAETAGEEPREWGVHVTYDNHSQRELQEEWAARDFSPDNLRIFRRRYPGGVTCSSPPTRRGRTGGASPEVRWVMRAVKRYPDARFALDMALSAFGERDE
jgi:hypothetical protein